ncbi:tRNA 2-thiocytidine(32) synthetase TtcA [Pandoraea horticolens]|uniref:tRNA-cytidine(32) 2-sulfurtransferase n=2 Tax=Pandoraea horticolens TaxID=2508298 RepID=A0A5E4RQT5_9BURK|nr:tRNA 2-thiocytidine(32) synthetase TtcA [Pandoraea horticolens]
MSAVMPETGAPLAASGNVAADSVKKAQKLAFENNKLEKRLFRLTGQAIGDYNMIEQGDRVMVCMSGGKDSYAMLDILLKLRERAPIDFSIVAVNLDQKQPGFPEHVLPDYFRSIGVDFHIENQDTYSIVKRVVPEGKTTCSLCSRLRRGILYRVAGELGATKVALGHHRDDIIETVFLNLFYGGKLKGMPPKLQSDDGKNVVIRPLAYVRESDLERYAEYKQFPIIPCTLCGSQPNLKRAEMKALIRQWEKQHPGRIKSIFSALSNVIPSHLMDTNLHDFKNLQATGQPDPFGDIAFDEAPCGDENDAGIIRITQFDD